MKRAVFIWFLSLLTLSMSVLAQSDRAAFFKALASGEEETIDKVLSELEGDKPSSRVNAYKGALTMKKAGFVKGVGGKLKTFKSGVQMLEDEIKGDPSNVEFRFLRLTIQENAPGILKYNKEQDEDKQAIVGGYSKLDPKLKSVIRDFAKNSKVLEESDLK